MTEDPDDKDRAWRIQRLVAETGVTKAETSDLIALLGMDWSSLVREARILEKKH